MDSPQYNKVVARQEKQAHGGFKPYYKWIVLNTQTKMI